MTHSTATNTDTTAPDTTATTYDLWNSHTHTLLATSDNINTLLQIAKEDFQSTQPAESTVEYDIVDGLTGEVLETYRITNVTRVRLML